MKKNVFVVGIISMALVMGFILAGCAGTPPDLGVYGNVSDDQLCTLEIAGGLQVTGFNDTKVSWAKNGSVNDSYNAPGKDWQAQIGGNKYKTTIKIPAGNHTLQANLYLWDYSSKPGVVPGAGYVRAEGFEISHDFQPGQTYFLRPVFSDRNETGEIIDYENGGFVGKAAFQTLSRIKKVEAIRLRIEDNGNTVAISNVIFY